MSQTAGRRPERRLPRVWETIVLARPACAPVRARPRRGIGWHLPKVVEPEFGLRLHRYYSVSLTYFSRRTPLKGAPSCFWSKMRPVVASRLVQFPFGARNCERSLTAPRRPGPSGGLVAMVHHLLP